jgi:pimeloyl-ACP methyl ester carboxylesterase
VIAASALFACAAFTAPPDHVAFRAADEVEVSGISYGSGRNAILLVPGSHGVGETWDMQARRLAKAGFRVLAIDYRGRGRLTIVPPDDEKAHLDVVGAARQLRAEGAERISVVGASWGGWAAATAAIAEPGLFDRVVLIAHSAFDDPEKLAARKLFIVAGEDRDGRGRPRLEWISEQFQQTPQPKALVVLDSSAHAQFLFLTPEGDRLYEEIERFLLAP